MNPDPFCGKQNGSRAAYPALSGGACRRMAAHVERLPRLILKAGCRVGCKAGYAPDWTAEMGGTNGENRRSLNKTSSGLLAFRTELCSSDESQRRPVAVRSSRLIEVGGLDAREFFNEALMS
jgi:hypothetical protein